VPFHQTRTVPELVRDLWQSSLSPGEMLPMVQSVVLLVFVIVTLVIVLPEKLYTLK
jgi:hypothetical protein